MASVNFMKCKSAGEANAMLRHCDKNERLKHEHSNKEIDKSKTDQNISYTKLDYSGVCKKYDDRIKQLDETTNTNKRKDRVSMFGLSIPAPEGMSAEESKDFFFETVKLLRQKYGADNIIGAYTHYDEIHQYIDGGEVKVSRPHLHAYVVPEIDGKLNGKRFSSKASMQALNREIDKLAKEKYQVAFLTGKPARHKSVEQLKELSEKELDKRFEIKEKLEKDVTNLESAKQRNEAELDKITSRISESKKAYRHFKADELVYPEVKKKKNLLGKEVYELTDPKAYERFIEHTEDMELAIVEAKNNERLLKVQTARADRAESEIRELRGDNFKLQNTIEDVSRKLDRATKARDHYKTSLKSIEKYAKEHGEEKIVTFISKVWQHPAVKVAEKTLKAIKGLSRDDYER